MDTQEVGEAIEQTNLLLGQAQVSLLYYRRMNILTELSSNSQAKNMLTKHKDLLEEENSDNELLGEEFRQRLKDIDTGMAKSAKVLKPHRQPFQGGLHHAQVEPEERTMCPPTDHHNFKEVVVEALPKAQIEVRNFYPNVCHHTHTITPEYTL